MKPTLFIFLAVALVAAIAFGVVRALAAQSFRSATDSASASGVAKRISLDEFDKLRADTNYTVLDVRTPAEFKAGHVPGATNINISAADFEQRLGALDKDKPYLVHCAVGGRSARAVGKMKGLGFKALYDFSGGWEAWKKAGQPVEK